MMKTLALGAAGLILLTMVVIRSPGQATKEKPSMPPDSQDSQPNRSRSYSPSGHDLAPLEAERVKDLAQDLSPQERDIILDRGTERAGTGALLHNKESGLYTCRLCGLPLFSSDAKYDSGCGWPAFFKEIDNAHVRRIRDASHGMIRTEIRCARCDAHLGHVFDDGPRPTGIRHCVNSASLKFHEHGSELPPESRQVETQTAYFAGGCFWGVEDRFQQVPGVIDAVSGYQGGQTVQPTYRQVCSGGTGHAESVRVTYDPGRVSYRELLERFFTFHDPTQLNRQGPDTGSQYRSAIFAADAEQYTAAKSFLEEMQKSERFRDRKIATQLEEAGTFYEAEEYHQDYHARQGGSCALPSGH